MARKKIDPAFELHLKQKRCLYEFMREQFGYEDDVYPSDALIDWVWHPIDKDGNKTEIRSTEQVGIYVKGTKNGDCWKECTYHYDK